MKSLLKEIFGEDEENALRFDDPYVTHIRFRLAFRNKLNKETQIQFRISRWVLPLVGRALALEAFRRPLSVFPLLTALDMIIIIFERHVPLNTLNFSSNIIPTDEDVEMIAAHAPFLRCLYLLSVPNISTDVWHKLP